MPAKKKKDVTPVRYSYLNSARMRDLVGRIIKKRHAWTHGKKIFKGNPEGPYKSWMHPKVRPVIEYMIKRNVFDNKVTTRKEMANFFDRLSDAALQTTPQKILGETIYETQNYLDGLIHSKMESARKTGKNFDRKTFLDLFQTTIDQIFERSAALQDNIAGVSYKGKTPQSRREKKKRYYRLNTGDAFRHSTFKVPTLIEEARTIKEGIRFVCNELRTANE